MQSQSKAERASRDESDDIEDDVVVPETQESDEPCARPPKKEAAKVANKAKKARKPTTRKPTITASR